MDKTDHLGSAPRPSNADVGAPGPAGISAGIRGDVRGMGFAAGEAHMTPNESKAGKRKGQVDIGSGSVVSVADVPVGQTARIEALVAGKRDDELGLAAEATIWDEAFADSGRGLALRRDKVEALYLAHVEKVPQTTGFKEEHGRHAAELVSETEHYMRAGTRTIELRLVAAASFAVLGTADRDFRSLGQVLSASGHARELENGGLGADSAQLAKEGDLLRTEAKQAGVPGMRLQQHGSANLLTAFTQLTTSIRGMTARAYTMRSQSLRQRSGDQQIEVDLLKARVDCANAIDSMVVAAAQALPVVGGHIQVLQQLTAGDAEQGALTLPSIQGLVASLIAGKEMRELKRAQERMAGLAQLLRSNEALEDVESIRGSLEAFRASADCFLASIDGVEQRNASRRDDLDTGGIALDERARGSRQLDRQHERFRPIAQRVAYLEAARSSNTLGQSALDSLEVSAKDAAISDAELRSTPITDMQAFDLRQGLGTSASGSMTRRVTYFRDRFDQQSAFVTAASKETS